MDWRKIFGISEPVSRKAYALIGFGLMIFKYLIEFIVIWFVTGQLFTLIDFLNPTITGRKQFTQGAPVWLGVIWVIWSLAFLWIAVTLSVRRAIDAQVRPSVAVLILLPILNIFTMLYLACVPTRRLEKQSTPPTVQQELHAKSLSSMSSALGGIAIAGLYGTTVIQASALWQSYGVSLFFGTPMVSGLASAYLFNLHESNSLPRSLYVAMGSVFMIGLGLLLFAMEGLVCIAMAIPIMFPLACLGGLVGKVLADRRRVLKQGVMMGCLMLPVFSFAEAYLPDSQTFVVTSTVTIDASPKEVWNSVIRFPDIEEEPAWFFRLGIACPERARIEGQGVGAVRHCEFTTGAFVEPITVWDPPRRLAFDVTEQPEPMFELTPYRHIHPPHLHGSFRSTRGEFRLIELPDGKTRLQGSTWYQLKIYPHAYWTLWTDWLVHSIHERVLVHIKRVAEESSRESSVIARREYQHNIP